MKAIFMRVLILLLSGLALQSQAQTIPYPVPTGREIHVDASDINANGLSDNPAAGTAVSAWNTLATANNLAQGTAINQPVMSNNLLEINNHQAVHFVPDAGANEDFLSFSTALTNIRTVFWVAREDPARNTPRLFMLGYVGSSIYDFHRSDTGEICHATYASANIRNGTTRLNGNAVVPTATFLPAGFNILSMQTTGDVRANTLSRDRTYYPRSWQGDMAEVVIYSSALTDNDVARVGLWLGHKYGIPTAYQDANGPAITLAPLPTRQIPANTPTNMTLKAKASGTGGQTISRVEFFINSLSIGSSTTPDGNGDYTFSGSVTPPRRDSIRSMPLR